MSHAGTERSLLLMKWNNRVTQLIESKCPIMLGVIQGIGGSSMAAPVSEAGGLGSSLPTVSANQSNFAKISAVDRIVSVKGLIEGMITGTEQILVKELPQRLE
jgi:NAD(P)H-dependent flavin oxidoreductase YrpB (nitropropane dioxygenase family)